MTTLHSIKVVVYSRNTKHLQKYLERLGEFFDAIPYAGDPYILVYAFPNCIVLILTYERTGCGQYVKDRAIEEYKQVIETRILKEFPSFFVEFFMHHWHLRNYKKEAQFIGTQCFMHTESLGQTEIFKNLTRGVEISKYFNYVNRMSSRYNTEPNDIELTEDDWEPGKSITAYLKQHGKEMEFPKITGPDDPRAENTLTECMIEDD
jgi:hypothetical protein